MNTKKKIEQFLRSAPKPPAPVGLLDKLNNNVTFTEGKRRVSIIRKWFAPAGGSISPWRVAAAVAIAIIVLLPLSYGATKVIKHFTVVEVFDATFEFPENNVMVGAKAVIASSDPDFNEEEAWKVQKEFRKLYEEGKAIEVEPGVWQVTLSDGSVFGGNIDPEMLGLSEAERKEFLKKQFDEIHELRKAGKFERTFIKEVEKNDVKIRLYEDRFTLSNGKVITIGSGEPIIDENDYED